MSLCACLHFRQEQDTQRRRGEMKATTDRVRLTWKLKTPAGPARDLSIRSCALTSRAPPRQEKTPWRHQGHADAFCSGHLSLHQVREGNTVICCRKSASCARSACCATRGTTVRFGSSTFRSATRDPSELEGGRWGRERGGVHVRWLFVRGCLMRTCAISCLETPRTDGSRSPANDGTVKRNKCPKIFDDSSMILCKSFKRRTESSPWRQILRKETLFFFLCLALMRRQNWSDSRSRSGYLTCMTNF